MGAEQTLSQWGQIVAKAWQDNIFKRRLLAEPAAVFKEFGLEVPPGAQLRILENTDKVVHLTLPAKPLEAEISDDELDAVAGGSGQSASELAQRQAMAQKQADFLNSLPLSQFLGLLKGTGLPPEQKKKLS